MNKEIFKIGNEIVALLPELFDAGYDFTKVLLSRLRKFSLDKGFSLERIDVVFTMSYDLNKNYTDHKMESNSSFIIYEDEKTLTYYAVFETNSTLRYGDLFSREK